MHAIKCVVCCAQGDATNSPATRSRFECGEAHCAVSKRDLMIEAEDDTKS